jgi:hypothetical protein
LVGVEHLVVLKRMLKKKSDKQKREETKIGFPEHTWKTLLSGIHV